MEYYILLLFKAEQYKEATKVFRKVRTNKNFNNQPEDVKERWGMYRVNLIYFSDAKILSWGFDLDEFLSTRPDFSKEHSYLNIASLVIQSMFLLRQGDIRKFKECVKWIVDYKSPHLDKRNNYRSSVFIRLLEIIIEKEFDFDLIQEKGTLYYQKLTDTKIPVDLETEMEVVPYERLWLHILRILKTNKAYVHYQFYNAQAM